MNWEAEVIRKKDDLIKDTQSFLQIESVLDEEGGKEGKPFGEKVDDALQYVLKKGEDEGFTVKNVDGYAGHIEYGEGEDIVGVLCHVDVVLLVMAGQPRHFQLTSEKIKSLHAGLLMIKAQPWRHSMR